jgi:hypothetical protein
MQATDSGWEKALGSCSGLAPSARLASEDWVLGKRCTSLLSALPKATNVRVPAHDDCVTVEPSELGQPQPGLDCEQQ